MLANKRILAVVTARAGSKGIANKNMRQLLGVSLIGITGRCLAELPWLDAKVITTDSPDYAAEAEKHGIAAPFLRPPALASDSAGSVATVAHALLEAEAFYESTFDVILIVEPTSPLRQPSDLETTAITLLESGADSAVTVCRLDPKWHPKKVLTIEGGKLGFFLAAGASVVARQSLETLYWRNGACYALTRECLLEKGAIFTDNTVPVVVDREMVNIDNPLELEWAEFLLERAERTTSWNRE